MKIGCFVAAVMGTVIAQSVFAGLVNPLVPSWHSDVNTQYMGWDEFTVAYGGGNSADLPGSSNLATLFNFGPGAIIAAAPPPSTIKGIYNPTGAIVIAIMGGVTSAPRNPTEVVMNVASAGTGINNSSVSLTLYDNAGNSKRVTPTSTLLRSQQSDGMGGQAITTAFSWVIDPLSWNTTRWQIDFSSTGAHAILDAVSLDMKLVPAPGALAVLAAFLGGTSRGRRRR